MKGPSFLLVCALAATSDPASAKADTTNLFNREPRVLAPEVAATLRGKRVFVKVHDPGRLHFYSYRNADEQYLHSKFDPDLVIEGGELALQGGRVPDPAIDVGSDILSALVSEFGVVPTNDPAQADLQFHVGTGVWQVSRRGSGTWLVYNVVMSIREGDGSTNLLSAECSAFNRHSYGKFLDAYFTDDMARFRIEAFELGKSCADEFIAKSLRGR